MDRTNSSSKFSVVLFVLIVALTLSSCAALHMQNQLDQHSKYLADLAADSMDPESKLELIALDIIDIMNESLQYRKASQSHTYIKKYLDKNEQELDALYGEMEEWYNGLR
jgi:hypothetical protein